MQFEYQVPKLAVIDDEPDIARLISDVADMSGYEVSQYFDPQLFVEQFNNDVDVIFLDLVMPEMSGMDVINFLATRKSCAQLILMTGFEAETLEAAEQLAISNGLNFISGFKKPFRFEELHNLLDSLKTILPARP